MFPATWGPRGTPSVNGDFPAGAWQNRCVPVPTAPPPPRTRPTQVSEVLEGWGVGQGGSRAGGLQPPPLSSCSLFSLTWLTTQSCAPLGLPRGTHLEPWPAASPTAHGGLSPGWGAPRARETRTR